MKTGVVVNNYDPLCKNRCQIRVNGLHTQTVNGKYIILDDDLPWALPNPSSTANSGNYSLPAVGDTVYVDVKDSYNLTYYGRTEIKGEVKRMMNSNADDVENMNVIAFSENVESNGELNYLKIYYLPENGLTIECNGNKITLPKHDCIEIKTSNGAGVSIDTSTNDITIHTDSKVKLDCKEVSLTEDAEERLILGSKLMEKFNTHTHFVPGGISTAPIQKLLSTDFSKKIKIG